MLCARRCCGRAEISASAQTSCCFCCVCDHRNEHEARSLPVSSFCALTSGRGRSIAARLRGGSGTCAGARLPGPQRCIREMREFGPKRTVIVCGMRARARARSLAGNSRQVTRANTTMASRLWRRASRRSRRRALSATTTVSAPCGQQ